MNRFISLLVIGLLVALSGCSDNGSSTMPTNSAPIAATTPTAVKGLLQQYLPGEDGVFSNGNSVLSDINLPGSADTLYDFYVVAFIWGHLFNVADTPAPPVVDWSGTLSMNGEAAINVAREIDFEAGQDSVLPSPATSAAVWVSQTDGDFDGLVFVVAVKRGNLYFAPLQLTFDTAPFDFQLSENQMAQFAAYYQVDNLNAVAVYSRKIFPANCPSGLMYGQWIKADVAGDSGYFQGTWTDASGAPTGVYSGTFWINSDGTRQFSGQVSAGVMPVIIAYLNGTWWYDDPRDCALCGSGYGHFVGKLTNASDGKIGRIVGDFGDLTLPAPEKILPMKGIWFIICPTVASNCVTPAAE